MNRQKEKKSQVEEYLDFYDGEGCQHVALATSDIVKTVTELKNRGVEFLRVPNSYYDDLIDRVGHIEEDMEPLKELGILVDRDDEGYLLQLFSKPVEDRPTLFLKSYNAKAQRVLAKAISKHYLKHWKENRRRGGICSGGVYLNRF